MRERAAICLLIRGTIVDLPDTDPGAAFFPDLVSDFGGATGTFRKRLAQKRSGVAKLVSQIRRTAPSSKVLRPADHLRWLGTD